jgi:hypothetical protein
MTHSELQLWIWRHFRFRLPCDWEMLQFSRNPESGRCAFADRYDFRFEFNWRVVPGPPDFDRMLSDYGAELKKGGASDVRTDMHGTWRGLRAGLNGRLTSRFGRHFPEASCLLEAVFLSHDGSRDGELEETVLRGIAHEPVRAGGMRRWRAFGMDFVVPDRLQFRECSVLPARVTMRFGDEKGRSEQSVSRLGMVRHWLKAPVCEHLKADPECRLNGARDHRDERDGHTITCIEGKTRTAAVPVFGPGRGVRVVGGWVCPKDRRFYRISVRERSANGEELKSWAGRLSCCAGKGLVA